MAKKFQRKKENFTCGQCGAEVIGNGYTNHCPKCLWSKHVDVNPGDRQETCQGMMKPVRLEMKGKEMSIVHVCERCGATKPNKTGPNDILDSLLKSGV